MLTLYPTQTSVLCYSFAFAMKIEDAPSIICSNNSTDNDKDTSYLVLLVLFSMGTELQGVAVHLTSE